MKKKILITLIAACTILLVFGVLSASAETEGIYTYIVSNGEATITECDKSVNGEIIIPDILGGYPVTNIDNYAFYGCTGLTNVIISDSVTRIGDSAFRGCLNLTNVEFNNNIKTIGSSAFSSTGIEKLVIPNSVITIGAFAFNECSNLTSVTIPNSVSSIGWDSFSMCYNLDRVDITDIGAWCQIQFERRESNPLYYASKLYLNGEWVKDLIIPEGITSVGDFAFVWCKSLETVVISESVKTIGKEAFYDCNNVRYIEISNGVETIGNSAFHGCYSAEQIIIGDGVSVIEEAAFRHCQAVESISLPNKIAIIEKDTFFNCRRLKTISIPLSVTEVKENAFDSCLSLTKVIYSGEFADWGKITIGSGNDYLLSAYESSYRPMGMCGKTLLWSLDENGVLTISGTGKMYNFNHDAPWEADKLKIKKVVIEKGVTKVGTHSFCGCRNLDSVIIPASVISSGKEAFCCDNYGGHVNKVYIEDIKSWCSIEFQDVRANPLCLNAELYLNDDLVENLEIPEEVSEIGWSAFYGCSSIKSVSIPSGMTGEYWYIFNFCINLEEIIVDSNNPVYSSLNSVLFSKDKTVLYQYPNGKKDSKYTIPDSVVEIGDEAFFNCTKLQYVFLPDSLTTIGNSCFNGCSSLKEIEIPNGVTGIRWWAFSRCKALESIIIPKSVVEIYDNAFNNCTKLADIYFNGTRNEWNNIVVGANNSALSSAKIHFCYTDTAISDDGKSFTVTPINIENGKTVVLALYNGEQFVEVQSEVYAGEAIPFTTTKSYTKAKVMVWGDLTNLKPVCQIENVQ